MTDDLPTAAERRSRRALIVVGLIVVLVLAALVYTTVAVLSDEWTAPAIDLFGEPSAEW